MGRRALASWSKGIPGRRLFGVLFAPPLTAADNHTTHQHINQKEGGMRRTAGLPHAIDGWGRAAGLDLFLQQSFAILASTFKSLGIHQGKEMMLHQTTGRSLSAVKKDGSHQGFIGISQERAATAATGPLLTPAETEKGPEVQGCSNAG
jgi:hypothetical protein